MTLIVGSRGSDWRIELRNTSSDNVMPLRALDLSCLANLRGFAAEGRDVALAQPSTDAGISRRDDQRQHDGRRSHPEHHPAGGDAPGARPGGGSRADAVHPQVVQRAPDGRGRRPVPGGREVFRGDGAGARECPRDAREVRGAAAHRRHVDPVVGRPARNHPPLSPERAGHGFLHPFRQFGAHPRRLAAQRVLHRPWPRAAGAHRYRPCRDARFHRDLPAAEGASAGEAGCDLGPRPGRAARSSRWGSAACCGCRSRRR